MHGNLDKNNYIARVATGVFCLLIAYATGLKAQENPHKQPDLNCETCHVSTATDWQTIDFNHESTGFPLQDRHQEVDCGGCHAIEDFRTVKKSCFSCHADVHQAQMGNDCEKCHSFQGWEIFDAHAIHEETQFPLVGQHALVDCESCHPKQLQGDFTLLTTDCIGCHQSDYLSTVTPNHVNSSFSTNCRDCHETTDWQPAFLTDHDSFFPVFSGQHDGVWNECAECHTNPATFVEFTCLTCHKHRQSEMDAKHGGIAGYAYDSNACLECHPQGTEGGFKDHDQQFFPIFSGAHANEWSECTACHQDPGNRQLFTCFTCHEHNQADTDAQHVGIQGYVYQSNDCLVCHPTGERGDFRDHDAQFFPIFSGKHNNKWDDCATCHPNPQNRREFTCFNCHEHSKSRMDDKHRNRRGYVYESSACLECHPDGRE